MKNDTRESAFRQRVLKYQQKGHSVTETANRYRMTRKSVYKRRNRWDAEAAGSSKGIRHGASPNQMLWLCPEVMQGNKRRPEAGRLYDITW